MSEELSREVELIRYAVEEIRDELHKLNEKLERIAKALATLNMSRVR